MSPLSSDGEKRGNGKGVTAMMLLASPALPTCPRWRLAPDGNVPPLGLPGLGAAPCLPTRVFAALSQGRDMKGIIPGATGKHTSSRIAITRR